MDEQSDKDVIVDSTPRGWLQMQFLGGSEVRIPSGPVRLESAKARALLVYLAMNASPQSRHKLMGLLWGDFPEPSAGRNLRHALWNLKRQLTPRGGASPLITNPESVAIDSQMNYWLDVAVFERLAAGGSGLSEAVALYRGDFLEGFHVRDAPVFEEWALVERERLRAIALTAFQRLTEEHAFRREGAIALVYARRWLAMDPWREEAHRQLMRLLAQMGQPDAALSQYETCRRILAEELGVEPGEATRALYRQIKEGFGLKIEGSPANLQPENFNLPSFYPSNLPAQATPFIGRAEELSEIAALLENPACRLLTLSGPGGIGKTRLALRAAGQKTGAFPQGVYFVSLGDVSSPHDLIPAIISALGFTLFGQEEPQVQLHNFLREKHLLLVLDSCEHLFSPSPPSSLPVREGGRAEGISLLIAALLSQGPRVKILVTSRERLDIQGEWVYPLEGLKTPEAIQLFAQTARRVHLGFTLVNEEAHVARICRLVYGVPLAIELAAAWVRVLSCTEIAREIEDNLEFLTTTLHDIPERHRSLRAVSDHSWNLLDEGEQQGFMKSSLFQGGFRREAAEQAAGATLSLLSALVDKSLLQRKPNGRYELHGLLRGYAAEKLRQHGQEFEARRLHCHYYAGFVQLREAMQGVSLTELDEEIENLRAAWRWASAYRDQVAIEKLYRGLYIFHEVRSAFQQGELLFREALEGFGWGGESPDWEDLLPWKLLTAWAAFSCRLGQYEASRAALESCLQVFRHQGAGDELAFCLFYLGDIARLTGDHPIAREYLQESLGLHRELGNLGGVGFCLNVMGIVAAAGRETTQARELLEESREIFKEVDHRWGLAISSINLANLLKALEDYPAAARLLQESLSLSRELGHGWGTATCLLHLGDVASLQGDREQAGQFYRDSLALQKEIGDRRGMLAALVGLTALLIESGAGEQALEILALVETHPASSIETRARATALLAGLAEHIPPETFEGARQRSQGLMLAEVVAKQLNVKR